MRGHRLTRHADFQAVYAAGRRFFSKSFIVFVLRHAPDSSGQFAPCPAENRDECRTEWRMGLAITRKTGSAVVRNRVKRVLREFFRLHGTILPHGMDIVVTPKRTLDPECVTLCFVERELAPVLTQVAHAPGQGNSRL